MRGISLAVSCLTTVGLAHPSCGFVLSCIPLSCKSPFAGLPTAVTRDYGCLLLPEQGADSLGCATTEIRFVVGRGGESLGDGIREPGNQQKHLQVSPAVALVSSHYVNVRTKVFRYLELKTSTSVELHLLKLLALQQVC